MNVTIEPPAAGGPLPSPERWALIGEIVAGTAVIAGHQRCAVARRLHRQGISMAHLQTLWILQEHGPQPMTHLADLLGVAVPNATGIIDRMEQRGLVERLRDGADRRVVTVRQTPEGARAVEEIDGWRSDMLVELLDRLDTDQLLRLVGGIQELRAAILTHGTDLPPDAAGPGPRQETARP
ncbi:MAG TPA: MarR family transcriptional regulator [Cryobacterium sp.]|nr:MarR family transcriptional regulator [Cryobacterium sp.]